MELYVLDKSYRRLQVIDSFESLIWTDRWQEIGDFELKVKSTRDLRAFLITGTWLAMSESNRIMEVEEAEQKSDEDGDYIFIKGRSFEKVMLNRMLRMAHNSNDTWYVTTSAIGAPQYMFDWVFGNPANPFAPTPRLQAADAVPLLVSRPVPPDDFAIDDGVEDVIDWVQERPALLYEEIQKHCARYNLGFRIVLDEKDGAPHLFFEVYSGRDLTTKQTNREPVIFSVEMGNLEDSTEFKSIQDSKNVAYVYTDTDPPSHRWVFRPGEAGWPNSAGRNRKVMMIHATVPDDWSGTVQSYLQKVGLDALRVPSRRGVSLFDGTVRQENDYEYGVDYEIGDVVELRNRDGVRTYKHVSEQIFVSDLNGVRSYPTLSVGKFDEYDTWVLYEEPQLGAETWEDFQFSQEAWGDM